MFPCKRMKTWQAFLTGICCTPILLFNMWVLQFCAMQYYYFIVGMLNDTSNPYNTGWVMTITSIPLIMFIRLNWFIKTFGLLDEC